MSRLATSPYVSMISGNGYRSIGMNTYAGPRGYAQGLGSADPSTNHLVGQYQARRTNGQMTPGQQAYVGGHDQIMGQRAMAGQAGMQMSPPPAAPDQGYFAPSNHPLASGAMAARTQNGGVALMSPQLHRGLTGTVDGEPYIDNSSLREAERYGSNLNAERAMTPGTSAFNANNLRNRYAQNHRDMIAARGIQSNPNSLATHDLLARRADQAFQIQQGQQQQIAQANFRNQMQGEFGNRVINGVPIGADGKPTAVGGMSPQVAAQNLQRGMQAGQPYQQPSYPAPSMPSVGGQMQTGQPAPFGVSDAMGILSGDYLFDQPKPAPVGGTIGSTGRMVKGLAPEVVDYGAGMGGWAAGAHLASKIPLPGPWGRVAKFALPLAGSMLAGSAANQADRAIGAAVGPGANGLPQRGSEALANTIPDEVAAAGVPIAAYGAYRAMKSGKAAKATAVAPEVVAPTAPAARPNPMANMNGGVNPPYTPAPVQSAPAQSGPAANPWTSSTVQQRPVTPQAAPAPAAEPWATRMPGFPPNPTTPPVSPAQPANPWTTASMQPGQPAPHVPVSPAPRPGGVNIPHPAPASQPTDAEIAASIEKLAMANAAPAPTPRAPRTKPVAQAIAERPAAETPTSVLKKTQLGQVGAKAPRKAKADTTTGLPQSPIEKLVEVSAVKPVSTAKAATTEAAPLPQAKADKPVRQIEKKRTITQSKASRLTENSNRVMEAMNRIPSAHNGALITHSELRAQTGLSKKAYDEAVVELAKSQKVMPHHHDFAGSLSPSELAELVDTGSGMSANRGRYWIGMAKRMGE